ALAPSTMATIVNYSGALEAPRSFGECLRWCERALTLGAAPLGVRLLAMNTAMALGDLARAWRDYDLRRSPEGGVGTRPFPHPLWHGEPMPDATLLVWAEQGLGDHIQFCLMLPEAIGRARRVVVECDRRLVEIFQRSFAGAEILPQQEPPHPRLG